MARKIQVMTRFDKDKVEALEEIGRELGLVRESGPRAGEVNISEVVRQLCAKADERMR